MSEEQGPLPTLTRRAKGSKKPKPKPVVKSVPKEGVVLEFIVDNKAGVMPDIPQDDYGSCICNFPLIQHQLIETDQDKAQIEMINQAIIADIDAAKTTPDTKNVKAHQTDFLFYKDSPGVDWVRRTAFSFVERMIDLRRWTLLPVDGWGIRYDRGDSAQRHAHWPHSWAYVYTVSAGPDAAPLEIYDEPDPAIQKTLDLAREYDKSGQAIPASISFQRHSVIPEAGKLCIFPGWVQHEVPKHESDQPRYIVAGNIAQVRIDEGKGI